jgi:hypothetical protein
LYEVALPRTVQETMERNGDGHADTRGLTAGWLAMRTGTGSARIEVMRRGGELFAVRPPGGREYVYPSWQFGPDGQVRPIVPRIIAAARARGMGDERLNEVLNMRVGLGSDRRVLDLAREGDEDGVLRAIRAASQRTA